MKKADDIMLIFISNKMAINFDVLGVLMKKRLAVILVALVLST